jgi:phosphonate dehydrogenase
MGAIGQAIATRLLPWNAKILYSDLTPLDPSDTIAHSLHFRTFDEVITHSDIVILALSLNEETFHRIDHEQLKKIKPGACIINPCRGSIVNEDAILASLLSGHLGGYAADVFEMEDWARGDRPAGIHPDLLNHPNTLFTAHIGSAVGQVRLAIEMRAADNILSVLRGAPPIDPANTLL